jgi:DNA-binding MarR family transcriptional regulator
MFMWSYVGIYGEIYKYLILTYLHREQEWQPQNFGVFVMDKNLERQLIAIEKRLQKLIRETVKEAIANELASAKYRSGQGTRFDASGGGLLVPIYKLSIPVQTTILALDTLGRKGTIRQIMDKTGMARSTETKHLSTLNEYGYIGEEKSIDDPRRKIYHLLPVALQELNKLPQEYRDKLVEKRIKTTKA